MSAVAYRDTPITLKGGFVVPVEALRLAWRLEEIGISMRVEGNVLVLRPRDRIPPEDLPTLRRYQRDIMRIVEYTAEPPA